MNRTLLTRVLTLSVAYFCSAAIAPAQTPSTNYAITHAKIFTLTGPPIDDGILVIRDGKIAARRHQR